MSAFLMDAASLAAIARASASVADEIHGKAEYVFNLLLDENLKSIGYRYPDATRISDWFDDGEAAFIWETIPEATHTATELLDLISSYQYQSCEHPTWNTSLAYQVTELLKAYLAPRVADEKKAEAAKVDARQSALAKLPVLYPKETAAHIRRLLRANFPATKFSVVTERGSMVSSVRVSWADGPTEQRVRAIVSCFKAGRFDGMTDSYDYDRDTVITIDGQSYRPGCQYVSTDRHLTAALMNRCIAQLATYWGGVVEIPTAVNVGGYSHIEPRDIGDRAPRPDLENGPHCRWYSLIRQAAEDRTRFTREG